MSTRISNGSVSAFVYGFACTGDGLVIWLDIAPQHPKTVGAIRSEMTSNTRKYMRITHHDEGVNKTVYGLGRGYINLAVDAPLMATGPRGKAQHLRMIAPAAVRPESVNDEFYILAWPQEGIPHCTGDGIPQRSGGDGITAATALAATLERYSPYPMRLEWGAYLLDTVIEKHGVQALITGGAAPAGYSIPGGLPWGAIIGDGLTSGQITLS